MKIKKWQELDLVKNSQYRIDFNFLNEEKFKTIQIRRISDNYFITEIRHNQVPTETVISFLKTFGFDIEFEEPIRLTEKEWHQVRVFDDGCFARGKYGELEWFACAPIREDGYWYPDPEVIEEARGNCSLPNELFKFITWESGFYPIECLRKLEKEV